MTYRLQRQKSGALAVHSAAYGETMHPGAGPWTEATRLYVAGSGLEGLLTEPGPAPRGAPVVVFDVGLGAAANALAAVACREALQRAGRRPRPLHLVSFEADPAGARFALEEADALGYPRGHEETLRALLDEGRVERPDGLTWELRLGDFPRLIRAEEARADVFFFDPFSPRANPAMWSVPTLEALYHCRSRGGPGRLVTYSTAMGTRAGLLLAGFFVGEGPRLDARRGSTVAAAWFAELQRPLGPPWLGRWRRDRDPWPPLTAPEGHRALRQHLLEHPQWAHFGMDAGDAAPPRDRAPQRRAAAPRRGAGGRGSRPAGAAPGSATLPPQRKGARGRRRGRR